MRTTLTIEKVQEYFGEYGYTLLTKEYHSAHTKLLFMCPNKHQSEMTWANFQQGYRCCKCAQIKRAHHQRHTLDYIRKFVEESGYSLLSKNYQNNKMQLEYRCAGGHTYKATWSDFQQGKRCPVCAGVQKKKLDEIQQEFKARELELVSTEYINARSMLEYVCSKGHTGSMTWNSFQQGSRCTVCFGRKRNNLESVRIYFKKEGYQLLSTEYVNAKAKLSYVCPQGHEGLTNWNRFKFGNRCAQCAGVIDPAIKVEKIRDYFEKEGYKLLSTEYRNPSTKLDFICPQGHKGSMSWTGFSRGNRCAKCMGRAIPSIEEIQQYFEQHGCKLLSTEYVDAHKKLDYICSKGHQVSISWTNFYNLGHRCAKCCEPKKQKRLGELLEQLFPGKVGKQDHFNFLGLLSVDYSVRDLGLAFEYDGEHHFMPTQYGNMSLDIAKERFQSQQERDVRKNRLCKENGYKLIRIAYYEDLTLENVQKKIGEVCLVSV